MDNARVRWLNRPMDGFFDPVINGTPEERERFIEQLRIVLKVDPPKELKPQPAGVVPPPIGPPFAPLPGTVNVVNSANDIYRKAFALFLNRLDGKTGWGKHQVRQLLLDCLLEAGQN